MIRVWCLSHFRGYGPQGVRLARTAPREIPTGDSGPRGRMKKERSGETVWIEPTRISDGIRGVQMSSIGSVGPCLDWRAGYAGRLKGMPLLRSRGHSGDRFRSVIVTFMRSETAVVDEIL